MSGIKLVPEGGGEAILVPDDSTVIGRGAFLKVTDKRVSRSHALLEIIDGKLYLTPTHTNPCFLRRGGKGSQEVLPRDLRQCLDHGDIFGLLPDQLFYTVTYPDIPVNGVDRNGETKDSIKVQPVSPTPSSVKNGETDNVTKPVKQDGIAEKEDGAYKESKDQVRPQIVSVVRADGKDMALPLEKKRRLPDWMVQAARATPLPSKKNTQAKTPTAQNKHNANSRLAAAESKRRPIASEEEEDYEDEEETERFAKGTKRKKPNSDEDYEEESEEESPRKSRKRSRKNISEDEDADYEEELPKRKRGRKRRKGSSDDDDDDYELSRRGKRAGTRAQTHESEDEDEPRGKRPQRAAKQKRGSYVDDFMGGEDFDDSDEPPEKPDSDSDFEVDEEDSGSDWERGRGSQKGKRPASRTPGKRGKKRKSKVDSDEDEEEEEDMSDEEYTPRPSRRRAASTPTKKAARKRKAKEEEEEDEDEEEDEMEARPAKGDKPRMPCWYGKKCYRKNSSHFKQFSHPGDDSYDEASAEDRGDDKHEEKRDQSDEETEEKR